VWRTPRHKHNRQTWLARPFATPVGACLRAEVQDKLKNRSRVPEVLKGHHRHQRLQAHPRETASMGETCAHVARRPLLGVQQDATFVNSLLDSATTASNGGCLHATVCQKGRRGRQRRRGPAAPAWKAGLLLATSVRRSDRRAPGRALPAVVWRPARATSPTLNVNEVLSKNRASQLRRGQTGFPKTESTPTTEREKTWAQSFQRTNLPNAMPSPR